jgi:hypothetical protein
MFGKQHYIENCGKKMGKKLGKNWRALTGSPNEKDIVIRGQAMQCAFPWTLGVCGEPVSQRSLSRLFF